MAPPIMDLSPRDDSDGTTSTDDACDTLKIWLITALVLVSVASLWGWWSAFAECLRRHQVQKALLRNENALRAVQRDHAASEKRWAERGAQMQELMAQLQEDHRFLAGRLTMREHAIAAEVEDARYNPFRAYTPRDAVAGTAEPSSTRWNTVTLGPEGPDGEPVSPHTAVPLENGASVGVASAIQLKRLPPRLPTPWHDPPSSHHTRYVGRSLTNRRNADSVGEERVSAFSGINSPFAVGELSDDDEDHVEAPAGGMPVSPLDTTHSASPRTPRSHVSRTVYT